MKSYKQIIILSVLLVVGIVLIQKGFLTREVNENYSARTADMNNPRLQYDASDQSLDNYNPPELPIKESYTIIIVGDSMTDVMGENMDNLRIQLKSNFPKKTFGLFNYGYGSTNLESLMDRLTTETEYKGKKYEPILSRQFDIIIIESFGHNPLSEYELKQGLKIQEELLTEVVERISTGHPDSLIIFLATIGADHNNYARGVKDLSPEERRQWAEERNSYIKNHVEFANEHNIPLINIYEKTLDRSGTVAPEFVNKDSWIHPSSQGVELISENISDFLLIEELILNQ